MKKLFSVSVLCAALPFSVHAQEASPAAQPEASAAPSWMLGVAASVQKKPYTGADTRYRVLPFVAYENSWFKLIGPGVGLKLGRTGGFNYLLNARYGLGEGYKSSDAWVLEGMNKRKPSVWVGPEVNWDSMLGRLSASASADVAQESKGYQATLSLSHEYRFGRFSLTPTAGLTWFSASYIDYYYGVTDAETTSWRQRYDGKASLDLGIGLRSRYMIDAHQFLSLDLGVKRLGAGITDSPLVDRTYVPQVGVGYVYRF
ncbi:MipA/OmpV family protein [Uliginosibacterium paludis]|uniref:MipA/OmpV family protein n=1 Tax=Uliginosibacterium paludis TaxID=1615952 RepID=A0ABV2CUB0_9RHOO